MKIFNLFQSHRHYWGVPINQPNGQNIQTCYGCGKNRRVMLQFELDRSDAASEAAVLNALYYLSPQEADKTRPTQSQ